MSSKMAEQKIAKKNLDMVDAGVMPKKHFCFGVRHLQCLCMCLTMITLFIARSSMGVAVLAMADEHRKNDTTVTIYDWDHKTQSVILSSFFWGYVTMQIPAGLLARRFGGKLILLVALLVNGCLCILLPTLAALGGWMMVCAARMMMGLSQACLFPASHTLLGQWLPPAERTSISGVVYGGVQVGTIIAMPVSGLLAETSLGWKLIFYTMSGLLFINAGIWYWFSASSPGEHRMISKEERHYIEETLHNGGAQKSMRTPWRAILTSVPLYAILATHIAANCSFILFFVDMPTYLEKGLQISLKNSAVLSALPYVGMWIGNTVSTIIAEKLLNRKLLSVTACRKLCNSIAGGATLAIQTILCSISLALNTKMFQENKTPPLGAHKGEPSRPFRIDGTYGVAAGLVILSFLGPEHKEAAILTIVVSLTMSGFTNAGFMVNGLDLAPNFAGVLLSLTNFGANFCSIGLPIIISFILRNDSTDVSRWRIVFLTVAAIGVVGNTVYLCFARCEQQKWNNPEYFDKTNADPEELNVLKKKEEAEI